MSRTKIPTYVVSMFHACATNDTNGNPRRSYVALGPFGNIVGAWREGYQGTGAVPESLRELASRAVRIAVAPAELRAMAEAVTIRSGADGWRDASAELRRRILKLGRLRGF